VLPGGTICEQVGYKLYWTPRHVAKNSSHINETYIGSVHSNVGHSDKLSTYTVRLRLENTLFAQWNTLTSKQQARQVDAWPGRLCYCGLRTNITNETFPLVKWNDFHIFVPCDLELRPLDLKCAPQLFLSSTMFTINFTPNQTGGQRLMRSIGRAT